MRSRLGVQKQSLVLGKITIKVRSESLWTKEVVPKQALKQKLFHEHYCSDRHNGIQDWFITLTDSTDTLKELKKKELY